MPAGQRYYHAAVYASAQESSHRHVRNEALRDGCVQLAYQLVLRSFVAEAPICFGMRRKGVVSAIFLYAAAADTQIVCRLQLLYPGNHALRLGYIVQLQILMERCKVQFSRNAPFKEGFHLR